MPTSILPPELAALPGLIDVRAEARLLGCSTRHVFRMSDGGAMPAPIKLGALVRWSLQAIQQWIDAGCPRCREN
jgi:predicted DNA-binding transcriptional regulator AlpA